MSGSTVMTGAPGPAGIDGKPGMTGLPVSFFLHSPFSILLHHSLTFFLQIIRAPKELLDLLAHLVRLVRRVIQETKGIMGKMDHQATKVNQDEMGHQVIKIKFLH